MMTEYNLAIELQKGEKGYKKIKRMLHHLDDMESIFIILARDQKIAYINVEGCKVLEAEYAQVVGKNWFDNFIPKHDRLHIKRVFDELMDGKIEQFNTNTNVVLTNNSNEVLIRWDNSLIKNEAKAIAGSFSLGKEERNLNDSDSIISICSYCKDVRNLDDKWEHIEKHFSEKYSLTFSHGICPGCLMDELEKLR